jgi:hypothetical protein
MLALSGRQQIAHRLFEKLTVPSFCGETLFFVERIERREGGV